LTVGDMVATVGPSHKVKNLAWDVARVTVCDYRGVSVDVFYMYLHSDGAWYAWTADTVFHASIVLREQFAAQYNRRLAAQ
jgi:hypothetical protein